ncbi:MAG: hypothetical protein IT379_07505 [Deltaproteobacteria bacterium]|nr:hypothetical protein [Deltaproteobacteria bacterium]
MRCYLRAEPVRGHVEDGSTRYVATGGGLLVIERPVGVHGRVRRRHVTPCDGLPGADVRAVAIHEGRLHVAIWARGLYRRMDDGGFEPVTSAGATGLEWPTALASLGGTLYVGTAYEGLFALRAGAARRPSTAFRERAVLVLAAVPGGRLAIGRPDGLYLFRPRQRAVARIEERGISHVELRDERTLLAFGEGTRCEVGLGSGDSGAVCAPVVGDPAGPPVEARGPGSNHVTTLAVRAGRLLVGTFDAGIAETDGEHWSIDRADDAPRWVNHLAVAEDGTTWVGAATGAYVLRGGRWRHYGRREGLPSSHVNAVARDSTGRAWLATGGGLVAIERDGAMRRALRTEHGLPSHHVVSLAGGGGAALVAGTRFGLLAFDGDTGARTASAARPSRLGHAATIADGSLPDGWITAVHEGPREWVIGTYARGLARGTRDAQGRWHFAPDARAPALWVNPNGITRVSVPQQDGSRIGVTVVMTLGDGVWVLRDGEERYVRAWFSDALPSSDVTAAASFAGRLWIGTRAGLVSLPLETLLAAQTRRTR